MLCGKRSQLVPSYHTHLVVYEVTSLGATCGTSWHLLVVRVDMGTSWHLLCGNRCQLVPPSDTCLVGYELTSNGGTSWHHLWYELTSIGGTSWHEYELTWVQVDIYSVVLDVNSYHHLILALLGTSWHLMVVRVDITCGTSWHLLVVRVDMGTSWHGYKLTLVRVDIGTSWPVFLRTIRDWNLG